MSVVTLAKNISGAGRYVLSENVSAYRTIGAAGQTFENVRDDLDDLSPHCLYPTMSSDDEQGYICSSSGSVYDYPVWWVFNNTIQGEDTCWIGRSSPAENWFQIQNTNGKFRTNMFTYYAGGCSAYVYRPTHLQILGSNDGENWDVLIDDSEEYPNVIKSSRIYHLSSYVSYSYIRVSILECVGVYASHPICRSFLIQDSEMHSYDTTSIVSSVKSGNTHTLTIDGYTPMTAQNNELVVPQDLPYAVGIVAHSDDIVTSVSTTYRTYKRDANGIPQLVLADITSVSSGLGKSTLNDDLQSLVTMAKVDDLIAKMNTCTYAGRIDSEDDLPTTDIKVGTVYLVGPEGSADHEEFIYTEQGTWERLGSVRSSDVDLSDYTNTEGMNTAIDASKVIIDGKITDLNTSITEAIVGMTTSVTTSIDAASTEVDTVLAGISKEVEVVEDLPAEWPTDIIDEGMLVQVIE